MTINCLQPALALAASQILLATLPIAAQVVPRAWDDTAVGGAELPLAVPERSPRYMRAAEYYKLPVLKTWKSYPMYRPGKEPPGYLDWLKQQEPQELQLFRPRMSEADWIAAGEIVFDMPISHTAFDPATNQYRNPSFYSDLAIPTDPNGVVSYRRYVIRTKGRIETGASHCGMCHTHVLPDGAVIKGAQNSFPIERSAAWTGSRDRGPRQERTLRIFEQVSAIPWVTPLDQFQPRTYDEILVLRWATPPYVTIREGTSAYGPSRIPDLIGIRDRRYLDATGLARNRDIADLMRYAIVNQTLQQHAWFGDYQPSPPPPDLSRYSDEQLYALAKFLYSLEPPPNPNVPDDLSRLGKDVFDREGCGACHTPPLYTSNKLTPAAGFHVPPGHVEKYDVMPVSVGTDPTLALRTRRGTGYYKIPSLKGVWYRNGFGHGGWCQSLEDWFDPARLSEHYVPTGFHLGEGPVKGHEFGLRLKADEKRALIAFLKTL